MTLDAKDTHARFFTVMLNGIHIQDVKMAYNNPDCDNHGFIEIYAYHGNGVRILKENGEPATVTLTGQVEFILDFPNEQKATINEEPVKESTPADCVFEAGPPVDKTPDSVNIYTGPVTMLTSDWGVPAHDEANLKCACPRCLSGIYKGQFPTNPRRG